MDVKSAFLNRELKEVVYVKQPPGYIVDGLEHRVLRLPKALHGLRCESEHALYTRRAEHELLLVGVYITGSRKEVEAFKVQMKSTFHMSDLGLLTYYLGIEVEQREDGITLCQSSYARKLLVQSGMGECRSNKTPMEEKLKLSKESMAGKVDATSYRNIVDGLRYLVHTRPDLALAVGYVNRFMGEQREDHWTAVQHILRYLARTINYGRGGEANLIGYSDSDMGGYADSRRSTLRMLFFLDGCAITWQSMKWRIVDLSTCEAEYVAAATACYHVVWLRRLLRVVTGEEPRAPILRVDNRSVIELAKNPALHDRSKHIDIRFHYIRESDLLDRAGLTDHHFVDPYGASPVCLEDPTGYSNIVGSLVYHGITRPDISYAIPILSQLMSAPTSIHYGHLLHVLRIDYFSILAAVQDQVAALQYVPSELQLADLLIKAHPLAQHGFLLFNLSIADPPSRQ
ncbi:hypothetical protein U9M48_019327, partial [Paspalum notatum var. saurae]